MTIRCAQFPFITVTHTHLNMWPLDGLFSFYISFTYAKLEINLLLFTSLTPTLFSIFIHSLCIEIFKFDIYYFTADTLCFLSFSFAHKYCLLDGHKFKYIKFSVSELNLNLKISNETNYKVRRWSEKTENLPAKWKSLVSQNDE